MEKTRNIVINTLSFAFVLSIVSPITALAAGPSAVNLGSAANFTVLAKSGITTTGTTAITGDIGVSPISATAITGFGLTLDGSNTFSTSAVVTGKVYASDYTSPTPATMTTAVNNMETAYIDAAGRTNPTATGLGAGNIGGMTLAPGLYKWSTGVTIPTDVTLSGDASDVWIFQIAGNLDVSSGKHVNLSGGAQAGNVFWQVAGQATIGTTAIFNGTILDQTAIVLMTGATLNGRALAQTAVTFDANTVSTPGLSVYTPPPVVTPPPVTVPTPVPVSSPVIAPVSDSTTYVSPVYVPTPTPTANAVQTQSTVTTTVTTYAPKLPDTGFAPQDSTGTLWNIIIPTGLLTVLISLYFTQTKLEV